MPKLNQYELVLQDWMGSLTFQMQALLLTGIRGPDENNKHNVAKAIVRYLRGVVIKPAGEWDGKNNNDWCWGEYEKFKEYANQLFEDHDYFPHHFLMHLIHCAEVIGYMHPNPFINSYWIWFYRKFVYCFHMLEETKDEMEKRLNDFDWVIPENPEQYLKEKQSNQEF